MPHFQPFPGYRMNTFLESWIGMHVSRVSWSSNYAFISVLNLYPIGLIWINFDLWNVWTLCPSLLAINLFEYLFAVVVGWSQGFWEKSSLSGWPTLWLMWSTLTLCLELLVETWALSSLLHCFLSNESYNLMLSSRRTWKTTRVLCSP